MNNDFDLTDVELEKAVLGGMLVNPSNLSQVALQQDDFYLVRHRWLYLAMVNLRERGIAVDIMTVTSALSEAGKLQEFGGTAYLVQLINETPFSYNVPSYALQLQELTRRRQVAEAAKELAKIAYDRTTPMQDKQAGIIENLLKSAANRGAVPIGQWADETYADILENMERGVVPVLKTGFQDLDFAIGGLDYHEGTMVLLTGEPGQGKTILMSNIAEHLQTQEPGAVYSLEMKRKRMMYRSFSARTGVSAWEMRSGKLSDEAFSLLGGKLQDYHKMRLYVSDHSELDTLTLQADLSRLKYEYGIKWYALDYMTMLTDGEDSLKGWERAALLSKKLLRINRRLGLASIVIHTLTKSGQVAGDIGAQYDADVILKLVKPEEHTPAPPDFEARRLEVSKNRDGELPLGEIDLLKHAKKPLFKDAVARTEHLNGKKNGKVQHA